MPLPPNSLRTLNQRASELQKSIQKSQKTSEARAKAEIAFFHSIVRAISDIASVKK